MCVNEDLYNNHLITPKLKNNQIGICKNASHVCFEATLFSSGSLCDLFPILFLILIFWGVMNVRNVHKKPLNKCWGKLHLRKSLQSKSLLERYSHSFAPIFFHSVTKHQLLAMARKETSELNYDSVTFGLAPCYVWDFCKYVTFWSRKVIKAYPQCSAKIVLNGFGKHCKLKWNKAVLQDYVS